MTWHSYYYHYQGNGNTLCPRIFVDDCMWPPAAYGKQCLLFTRWTISTCTHWLPSMARDSWRNAESVQMATCKCVSSWPTTGCTRRRQRPMNRQVTGIEKDVYSAYLRNIIKVDRGFYWACLGVDFLNCSDSSDFKIDLFRNLFRFQTIKAMLEGLKQAFWGPNEWFWSKFKVWINDKLKVSVVIPICYVRFAVALVQTSIKES